MTIRCVYHGGEPSFPATDQHPDAVRYFIAPYVVDAIGGGLMKTRTSASVGAPPMASTT